MNPSDDHQALDAMIRRDLKSFIRKAFATIAPGEPFTDNWHIEAITEHLRRCSTGAVTRLQITQPPRSLKSICTAICYVAWRIGNDPSHQFICVSYSSDLASDLSSSFRRVVESEWYRRVFPGTRFTRLTETECVTDQGGGRIATSIGGTLTGRGADTIIIDDPLKAEDAHSETARRKVIDWFNNTLVSRLNDKRTGTIIIVMQRLHEDDLIGHLEQDPDWVQLDLPAIAQEDQDVAIGSARHYHFETGEALQGTREPLEDLERLRKSITERVFSAQYLQRPVPAGGNLVHPDWFKTYDHLPSREPGIQVVQSWDIATTTNQTSDYSVCTTWHVKNRHYFLADVYRERLEFPAVKKKICELAEQWRANTVLIEDAGPGTHLLQELKRGSYMGTAGLIGIRPKGDKLVRMEAQTSKIEEGRVLLPDDAPWLAVFMREILAFPNSRNDDQVDSVSQFLNWIGGNRSLRHIPAAPILIPLAAV